MRRIALIALALLTAPAHAANAPGAGDSYFSAHVKLAPDHYIDRDSGLDCVDAGAATVCQPPDGTVRYFDPAQGARCTRTGAAVLCAN